MRTTGRLDLLQITLVVRDLAATEAAFAEALGLEVAFRDPSVDLWGLENIVLPMGTTFIEILSPKRADTPGGRHLDRQGGDGGYMVILQTRDLTPWRERIKALGLRVAFEDTTKDEEHGQNWSGIHLHPRDTGGMMISLDQPDPPDSWVGAGPVWREHICQDVVDGLAGIELRSPDPGALARRCASGTADGARASSSSCTKPPSAPAPPDASPTSGAKSVCSASSSDAAIGAMCRDCTWCSHCTRTATERACGTNGGAGGRGRRVASRVVLCAFESQLRLPDDGPFV